MKKNIGGKIENYEVYQSKIIVILNKFAKTFKQSDFQTNF